MGFLDKLAEGLQDLAKEMNKAVEKMNEDNRNKATGINGLRCTIDPDSLYNHGPFGGGGGCGSVENIGISTYKKVVVHVVYKNKDGRVVDKQDIFIRGMPLYPGESVPFDIFSHAKNIDVVSASINRYEEI